MTEANLKPCPEQGEATTTCGIPRQQIEDEMLVRGVGEHAGAQGHGRAVGGREVARGRLAQRRFVDRARLALEIVGVDLLLEMMVETDLEPRHVVLRESRSTVPPGPCRLKTGNRCGGEERRLAAGANQPSTCRSGWARPASAGTSERHPGAGREHEPAALVDAALGRHPHAVADRFPVEHSLPGADVGAGRQRAFDVGADAALRQEKAAAGLEQRQVARRAAGSRDSAPSARRTSAPRAPARTARQEASAPVKTISSGPLASMVPVTSSR